MNESEVNKVQSDLRRPERWRGRVRGPFAEWSVFAGAAVAILLGVLFWTSVWVVFRTPSTTTVASSDLVEEGASSAAELEGTDAATADTFEDLDVTERRAAETANTLDDTDDADVVDEADDADDADEPAWQVAEGPDTDGSATAEEPDADLIAVAEGPVYGPEEPMYGPMEPVYGPAEPTSRPQVAAQTDAPDADVATDAPTEQVAAARPGLVPAGIDEITARAGEITVRAEEMATRAEEFAARIEGLTAKIDELEAKLGSTGPAGTTRAAVTASPVPAVARQPETVVVRNAQALGTGRAPWVVSPLPEPGTRVKAGPVVIEARARGEAPIAQIRIVLDGAPMQVALERRDEKTWRGSGSARVAAGSHTVAVSVTDSQGRVGSFRWQFDATP